MSDEEKVVEFQILPGVIKFSGHLSIVAAIFLFAIGFENKDQAWLMGVAVAAVICAPLIYAVADIVVSLRAIRKK